MLRLPIGYDNFGQLIQNQFDFVDKSLFVRDVFDDLGQVIVITRPRRFGKTLNLSLLQHFLAPKVHRFETQGCFDALKIAQCGEQYMSQQGQHVVVSISLKDVKESNFDLAYEKLGLFMATLYDQYRALLDSSKLSTLQKQTFRAILQLTANRAQLEQALELPADIRAVPLEPDAQAVVQRITQTS